MSDYGTRMAPVTEPPPPSDEVFNGAAAARERRRAAVRALKQERRFLFRCLLGGCLAAALLALILPVRYESTARLMPPDSDMLSGGTAALFQLGGASGAPGGGLGGMAAGLLGTQGRTDLFVEVLRSRSLQDEIINQFNLRKVYGVKWMEDARKILVKKTVIVAAQKSNAIGITVTDHDRVRARDMVQAYVDGLNRIIAKSNTSAAHRERVFLEERLAEVKKELEINQKRFGEYASTTGAIDTKEQGRAMVEAAATLEGQYIAAQSELRGLEQIYAPNNVRVRSARARVEELKRQLHDVAGDKDSGSAEKTSSRSFPSIRQLPLLGVQWADLYRAMRISEITYETLTKEYELARVNEAKELPSVSLLDPPELPEKKSWPPRTLITLLGGLLSFVAGIVIVLERPAWERMDPDDPRKLLVRHASNTWQVLRLRARHKFARRNSSTGPEESSDS